MLRRPGMMSDEMLLAVAVWLCILPLLALLVVPVWGLKTAGVLALVALVALMVVCWGLCGWKIFKK